MEERRLDPADPLRRVSGTRADFVEEYGMADEGKEWKLVPPDERPRVAKAHDEAKVWNRPRLTPIRTRTRTRSRSRFRICS